MVIRGCEQHCNAWVSYELSAAERFDSTVLFPCLALRAHTHCLHYLLLLPSYGSHADLVPAHLSGFWRAWQLDSSFWNTLQVPLEVVRRVFAEQIGSCKKAHHKNWPNLMSLFSRRHDKWLTSKFQGTALNISGVAALSLCYGQAKAFLPHSTSHDIYIYIEITTASYSHYMHDTDQPLPVWWWKPSCSVNDNSGKAFVRDFPASLALRALQDKLKEACEG